jgi:alpha-L-arabinofuranosidase
MTFRPLRRHLGGSQFLSVAFLSVIFFALSALAKAQEPAEVKYQPVVPPALLPDGTPFLTWSDTTHYTRTYHVSQNHSLASDDNDGSEEHPFRTINHAAQLVKPGERVLIHAGIYRELVRPRFSGEGPDRMIAYEAAPGDQVILRGSRVLNTKWRLAVDPVHDSPNATEGASDRKKSTFPPNIYSKQLWMTRLPEDLFQDGYFPFRTPNMTDEEQALMPWAEKWKGRIPYSLPRGLLFQEGRRMVQMGTFEDLVRLPGSYWVSPDGETVRIHPYGGGDPNEQLFEAAVQQYIIQPQTEHMGFIRVSGLTLEHCANGFLRSGVGALFAMGGHHWIIEGNTVRHINSLGIEVGDQAYERQDRRAPDRKGPDVGYNIVRRNSVFDCGTTGIRGLCVAHGLVEQNNVVDCGWQDAEFHWEVAGIKLLITRGALVRNNHISHIQGGGGIWLDWDNQNSRITGNVIHDISGVNGAIYIEASQKVNMIDDNVMWNINSIGVRLCDTDNVIVAHNLFGHVADELVMCRVAGNRTLGGRKVTSNGNRVVNNFIVDQGKPVLFDDPSNVADCNVYVSTHVDQTATTDSGEHSMAIHGDITFDGDRLLLTWKSAARLPMAPILKNCELDFFRRERTENHNVPGPFLGLENPATLQLRGRLAAIEYAE